MKFLSCVAAAVLVSTCLARVAPAQRDLREIPSPDPELERQSFLVHEGFEVQLYAADPLLAKPIQMNFDAAGRLWVASSEVYPQILPGQQANDKIVVLEDRDADGQADKTTVFAEGLLIPTGVEPGDGGAYVANSTELVHLADTDGDGRADRRRVMLSGFGTEDTHHIIHTFRWGHDGALYFNQSIYIHSHIETPHGIRRLGAGGIWRFRPETLQLDVLCRGLVNPWGHHFDRWGQSFATDGAGGDGIHFAFPGATFTTASDAPRILSGLNPGSPKHCGLEIVSGRHLPDDWQGSAITHDFRGHRVCRFVISEDGSGFSSREAPELIKTTHAAFRPIDVKMGPDGAIYIADWYNPIIQHGEVDFRDPRRDHTHGRIWRVTAKGRPLVPRPKLAGATNAELLALLQEPEAWTRHQARFTLRERYLRGDEASATVRRDLEAVTEKLAMATADADPLRLETLWTWQSIDVPHETLLTHLLVSKDPRVRAAAVRVAADWQGRLPLGPHLMARALDEHPRPRLEAVRALARAPSAESAAAALRALERPRDTNLDFALWLTARETQEAWLPGVLAGKLDFGGRIDQLEFALRAVDTPKIVPPLVGLLESGKLPAERHDEVLAVIARLGTAADLALVLDLALDAEEAPAAQRARWLEVLAETTRTRRVRPAGDLARLAPLVDDPDAAVRAAAVRAAGTWQVPALRPRIHSLATTAETPAAVRAAAIASLAQGGGADARRTLSELAGAGQTAEIRSQAIVALATFDAPLAATQAVALLGEQNAAVDPAPLVAVFVSRKNGAATLTQALAGARLPADVVKRALRAARATAQPSEELLAALRTAGGISGQPAMLAPEQLQALVTDVLARGNPARGEAVFRRAELNCLKCHAIGGAGGQVGPDLISLGASAQVDYLVESILAPSKKIKENYHALVVQTDDGRVITGVRLRETDRELFLRNAEDQEVSIPKASIEEQSQGQSLMPAGLADDLTRDELIDVVRFLSELGRVGPYALGNARVVRRWQTLEATPEAHERIRRTRLGEAATADPVFRWNSAYSLVSGELPIDAIPGVAKPANGGTIGFARFQLSATTGGVVRLAIHDPEHLTLWLDGQPLTAERRVDVELAAGLHTVTVAVASDARREPLRVELLDVAGSPARVQLVGGK